MVSYYDLRSAKAAMRGLQVSTWTTQKSLRPDKFLTCSKQRVESGCLQFGVQGRVVRRRRLDIHYSIPKDNPNDRDSNQARSQTLLEPCLRQLSGHCRWLLVSDVLTPKLHGSIGDFGGLQPGPERDQ